MLAWLEEMVLRYGLSRVLGVGVLLALLLTVGLVLEWSRLSAWFWHRKADHLEAKLEQAKVATKVARQDEAQTAQSAEVAKATTAAQDKHTAASREATARGSEVIHERIREAPAAVVPVDDDLVRGAALEAVNRAQVAADRLQGTPSR